MGDREIVQKSQYVFWARAKGSGENPPRGVGEILQREPSGGASAGSALCRKLYKVAGECVETRSVNSSTRKGFGLMVSKVTHLTAANNFLLFVGEGATRLVPYGVRP